MKNINAYHIYRNRSNLLINSIQHNKEKNINTAHLTMFLTKF